MNAPAGSDFVAHGLPPPLQGGEIHLWHAQTREPATTRAHARAVLRELLGAYAGTAIGDADIASNEHGKPFVRTLDGLEFNLSHAGTDIVLAFARGQALGVDVEHLRRRAVSAEVARRFFHASEADALARLPEALRQLAFLQLWTHKEAVLKAIGHGLSFGLARLEFALDADGSVRGLRDIAGEAGAATHWCLHPFAPGPHLVGCLAWHGPPRRVRTFAWAR